MTPELLPSGVVRLVGLVVVAVGVACVAPSTELGVVEGAVCAPELALDCSVPPTDGCGDGPTSELDENCCRRSSCERHSDCAEGLVCNLGGMAGFGCADAERDGETVCECGGPPSGLARPMCIPLESVPPDWCTQLRTQGECEAGEAIALGDGTTKGCAWIELFEVRFDAESSTCAIEPITPTCITVVNNGNEGCPDPLPCTLPGQSTVLGGALARPLDDTTYDVFAVGDELCNGADTPVGDWIPADDPSLGACAMSCGF